MPIVQLQSELVARLQADSMFGLVSLPAPTTDGFGVELRAFYSSTDAGGGRFYWDASRNKASANGGTIIDPTTPGTLSATSLGTFLDVQGTGVGTGCWIRQYSGHVDVTWFGAVGDGIADDTTPFKKAANTGEDVYIPRTTSEYKISQLILASAAGQAFFGDGERSLVRQTGTDANSIGFKSDFAGVAYRGIHVKPGTTGTGAGFGKAFFLRADKCSVVDCMVSQHRLGAIYVQDASYCLIIGNRISNADVDPLADHSMVGVDIYIADSGSRNVVSNNIIDGSCGTGISVQSLTSGAACDYNVISNNVIKNCPVYGIILYRGVADSTVQHNIITSNVIDEVKGNIPHTIEGMTFGAGIYVQGAEYTTVSCNHVNNTNINTELETLAPAGIGVTNCRDVTITDNTITNARWYGIALFDPNQLGTLGGVAIVTGNTVVDSEKASIYGKDFPRAIIENNSVFSSASHGIHCRSFSTPSLEYWTFDGNVVKNCTSNGIQISNCLHSVIRNNISSNNSVHGISISHGVAMASGNITNNNSVRGLETTSAVTGGLLSGNYAKSNSQNYVINGKIRFDESNISETPLLSDFSGTSAPGAAITDGATTPDLSFGSYYKISNTSPTTITGFNGGYDGQTVLLVATTSNTTIQNSSSILLAGSTNYVMGSGDAITFKRIGTNWQEIARVVR